jgi:hypothetical protein
MAPSPDEIVKANYVTCPEGHKAFIVWLESKQCFAFTCDECLETSRKAMTGHGIISIKMESQVV